MAFSPTTLNLLSSGSSNGPKLWHYTNIDAHTAVDESEYFVGMGLGTGSGATNRGMKVNDILLFIDTDTATLTMHIVTTVAATGNVTVAAATLA